VLVLVAAAAGCGYDTGGDLRPVVADATPPGARLVGACGGSSGVIESPSHSCKYLVPGNAGQAAVRVAQALEQNGFRVSCEARGYEITLLGERGDIRVVARAVAAGTVIGDGDVVNVNPGTAATGGRQIPRGFAFLDLDASRRIDTSEELAVRSGSCAAPALAQLGRRARGGSLELVRCELGWNPPANARSRRMVARRHPAPIVAVFDDTRVDGCVFRFVVGRAAYDVKAEWVDSRLVVDRPLLQRIYGVGDPRTWLHANARLRPNGTLALNR
jgi:hypothetical protein